MLSEKAILITGASSGIGAALAREASRQGASVMLAARRQDRLAALAGELRSSAGSGQRILIHPCDVSDRRQAEHLVSKTISGLGRLDVLINNAGRGHFASIEDTTDETIQSMFALNVFSLWYTIRSEERRVGKECDR
jgi:short-subunit dehydrogenase